MAVEPTTTDSSEAEALRARIDALEREQHERTARANAALAAAQDRYYWLDRWNLDLNAVMRRPGAAELRAALRGMRKLYRLGYDARRQLGSLPLRLRLARQELEEEEAALWETADPIDRKRRALAFAAHHGIQPALGHSGLSAAAPATGGHS